MRLSSSRVAVCTILRLVGDLVRFVAGAVRSRAQLSAENLFLRKQLALYTERQVKPRRADDATRVTLVAVSWLIDLRRVLVVVKPDTLIRWHRQGFRLFWRWKSPPRGRPRLPSDLRRLIAEMALANRTWGEKRIASELLVKLGIHVSPRTVRCYMATGNAPRDGARSQRWSTFVRNHPNIRRQNGRRSNSAWCSQAISRIASSFTITTASIQTVSIGQSRRWGSPFSRRPRDRRRRTPSANA